MPKPKLSFPDFLHDNTDFHKYGKNDVAVFALGMYLNVDDIESFMNSSWTEDYYDKKIDLFYIDLNESRAAIVQVYISEKFAAPSAPGNKASDLNTACSWVFSADESTISDKIRPKSMELRNGLKSGDISRIDILYVHNCLESPNVEAELRTVADGARDKIISLTSGLSDVKVHYKEIGVKSIDTLYKTRDKEILVEDVLTLPRTKFLEEKGDGWKAIQLTVEASWIRDLYLSKNDSLFSANYRDYLGFIKKKGNINFEITSTANEEPDSFWVYNN
jgi:hypothetical protein